VSKVEVRNLSKSFGDLLVLDNVSFDVDSGEFLCIVGPTGCGKTTFLNSLTKIYDIDSGSIKIDGKEVDLRKHSLAYIMQEYSTMSWLTVRQNVQFGLKVKKLKKAELENKTGAALELVGLSQFQDYYPNQLSASMMQRVAIARAFAVQPDLLLMDEPYGQLDLELRFKLEDELLSLWRKLGTTIIFITHNIEEAVYLSQRILVLTNKPTAIKENVANDLPFPRKITGSDFIRLRNRVTELIKWW
jgi:sulfonate transport system ATP-binding protein